MNSIKGTMSGAWKDFMEDVRQQAGEGSPTPPPPPRHEPAHRRQQPPAVNNGGQPPRQPPVHGGGGSGGGFQGWAKENQIIVLSVVLLLLVIGYIYFNDMLLDKSVAAVRKVNDLNQPTQQASAAPSVQQSAPSAPVVQNQIRTIDDITDGAEVALPADARIILRGPMTVTFIDSTATRIKGFTGDFKLHIEGSQNYAWTPGFSSEAAPMSPSDFLGHLRRVLAKKPNQVKVKMFINTGVVELNT